MNYCIPSLRALILLPFLVFALALPSMADDDETPLGKEMSKINKGYKLLGRQARTGQFDYAALGKAFADARIASQSAARLVPAKLAKMKDGRKKQKALADYQKQLAGLTDQLSAISALCKAKDGDKLKATYDRLKKMKQKGHDKFIDDE